MGPAETEVVARVEELMPRLLADLVRLTAIPSVSGPGADPDALFEGSSIKRGGS